MVESSDFVFLIAAIPFSFSESQSPGSSVVFFGIIPSTVELSITETNNTFDFENALIDPTAEGLQIATWSFSTPSGNATIQLTAQPLSSAESDDTIGFSLTFVNPYGNIVLDVDSSTGGQATKVFSGSDPISSENQDVLFKLDKAYDAAVGSYSTTVYVEIS